MSEVSYKNKGPAPQVHNNEKLQIRQGSPAHYQASTTNSKTEMRPQSTHHTMGAKSGQLPPHLAGRQPAEVQPPKVLGGTASTRGATPPVLSRAPSQIAPSQTTRPKVAPKVPPKAAGPRHTPGSVGASKPGKPTQATTPAVTAPLETRLISPEGALLLGQIAEMFIAAEQFSGRGETDLVKLAVKTLTDMQPLFPPGIEIPIPNVTPPVGEGSTVTMVPLEPPAIQTAPETIAAPTASSPPAPTEGKAAV
jgi:hypothetical protein